MKDTLKIGTGVLILLNFFIIPMAYTNFVWIIICGMIAASSYLDYKEDSKRMTLYVTIFFVAATIMWAVMTVFPR